MPTSGAASPLPLIVGVAHLRGVKATLRDAATVRLPFGPLPPVANRPGSVSSLSGLDAPVARALALLGTAATGEAALCAPLVLLAPTTGSACAVAPEGASSDGLAGWRPPWASS